MTPLQQELKGFLQEKGVTPLFYPHTRGSKVIEFAVRKEQESAMANLIGHTFSNKYHRLTFSPIRYGGYACNFQPLLR